MAWTWTYEDAAGNAVESEELTRPEFPSQSDAESWVGETWRELLDAGVEQVRLFDAEREVYGPMSLRPAE
ncbi:hypothetical protein [Tenggerimyces flavus]|uniref:Uncharacterized protein n=1 Tax=Tenggerimyces flavus TaxID=1708749 RepID=A0ABV7YP25_9ACTN|nr:hypothetical protein [Tenggerimyces flavus]MBM7788757.1 hypothetical protein [Tenggerimyces flavus]